MLYKLPPARQLPHPDTGHLRYRGPKVVSKVNEDYLSSFSSDLQLREIIRTKSFQCVLSKFSDHMSAILLMIPKDINNYQEML